MAGHPSQYGLVNDKDECNHQEGRVLTLQMSPLVTGMQTGATGWADLNVPHLNCANEVEKRLTVRALWFGFVPSFFLN